MKLTAKLDSQFIELCEKSKNLSAENMQLKSKTSNAKRRIASLNGIQGDSLDELVTSLETEIRTYEDERRKAHPGDEAQHHGIVKMIDLSKGKKEKTEETKERSSRDSYKHTCWTYLREIRDQEHTSARENVALAQLTQKM
jgi:hypothetical protein